jgi:hypothetical protein
MSHPHDDRGLSNVEIGYAVYFVVVVVGMVVLIVIPAVMS